MADRSSLQYWVGRFVLYPATMLKLEHKLGRLAPGYQADMIAIDDDFVLHHSWIAGNLKRY